MFTNPLDNIRVASPCPADWDQMFGDERTRFCSQCKLNVYNLSGMTRREAENLLINSEGPLCVRYFKRADGTVLTRDCPVGWAALKRRVSKVATAVASVLIGFLSGIVSVRSAEAAISLLAIEPVPAPNSDRASSELDNEVVGVFDVEMGEAISQGEVVTWVTVGRVVKSKPSKKKKPSRKFKPTVIEVGMLEATPIQIPRSLNSKRK